MLDACTFIIGGLAVLVICEFVRWVDRQKRLQREAEQEEGR